MQKADQGKTDVEQPDYHGIDKSKLPPEIREALRLFATDTYRILRERDAQRTGTE